MPTYDAVPYPNLSHVQSHPDSVATLARLLGMSPAPVDACRVLEIGCASGGNLIPMAVNLPGSTFVGIDYSALQIEAGQADLAAVGLKNVSLRLMDIMEVTPDFGEFDFILAHGVYSWVPAEVRDRLLAICKQNLAPNGLAYVSYNVYPGWHMLGSLREMMLYHIRGIEETAERAQQARGLLQFMAEAVPTSEHTRGSLLNAFSKFLTQELERIGPKSDAFLLHDELEEINEPVYFHQFNEQAERHGLQFVSEMDFRSALPSYYPKQVTETLLKTARSVTEMEQYLDFLRCRTFRQTLLSHQGLGVNRTIVPERIQSFHIASRAVPETVSPDIYSRSIERFKGMDGATLSIDHPVSKAAILHLATQWPRTVPYHELLPAALARLNGHAVTPGPEPVPAGRDDNYVLSANLLKAFVYSDDLVEVHTHPPAFTLEVSERPLASPWARRQAETGTKVTNLRHERIDLDPLSQYLLPYVDGKHDVKALVKLLLAGPVASGTLVVQQADKPATDPVEIKQVVSKELEDQLLWLARAALLVA